jgi:hypothetical protein
MATTKYLDNDNNEYAFQQEAGDAFGEVRSVVGLPAAVRTAITNITAYLNTLQAAVAANRVAVDLTSAVTTAITNASTYLNTLQGAVTGGRIAVDLASAVTTAITNTSTYLNTLQGAVAGGRVAVDLAATPLANLVTIAGAITSARMAVNVDTTTTAKLDTLHTDIAPATLYIEQITAIPAIGGTASQFTSQTLVKGMVIRNCSTGGQLLYITKSATTPTATNSYVIAPGESTPFLECTNANAWKVLASAASGAACMAGS